MEESDNRCGEGVVGWGGTGLAIQERKSDNILFDNKAH